MLAGPAIIETPGVLFLALRANFYRFLLFRSVFIGFHDFPCRPLVGRISQPQLGISVGEGEFAGDALGIFVAYIPAGV